MGVCLYIWTVGGGRGERGGGWDFFIWRESQLGISLGNMFLSIGYINGLVKRSYVVQVFYNTVL